jgi:hypothetical protein
MPVAHPQKAVIRSIESSAILYTLTSESLTKLVPLILQCIKGLPDNYKVPISSLKTWHSRPTKKYTHFLWIGDKNDEPKFTKPPVKRHRQDVPDVMCYDSLSRPGDNDHLYPGCDVGDPTIGLNEPDAFNCLNTMLRNYSDEHRVSVMKYFNKIRHEEQVRNSNRTLFTLAEESMLWAKYSGFYPMSPVDSLKDSSESSSTGDVITIKIKTTTGDNTKVNEIATNVVTNLITYEMMRRNYLDRRDILHTIHLTGPTIHMSSKRNPNYRPIY